VGLINALIDSVNRFLGVAEDIDGVLKITSEKFPDIVDAAPNNVIPVRITGSTATGNTIVWTYTWVEIEHDGSAWVDKPNGRSGSSARNSAEKNNVVVGPTKTINYGQELTDDATATYTVLPIVAETLTDMQLFDDTSGGGQEGFTASPNPITVTCL